MTRVRPPRPFPPHEGDPEGVIDLGVRLRDTLFRRSHIERAVRPALKTRLNSAIESEQWGRAEVLLGAIVDTWPIASVVDAARRAWTEGPDGPALSVLHRAAELTAMASDAPLGWPTPTTAWVKRTVGNRIITGVERRCGQDGAAELAEVWNVPIIDAPITDLSPVVRQVLEGQASGLNETERAAIERFGLYGSEVPEAPPWAALVRPAPPGQPGPTPTPLAVPVELPGTARGLREGQTGATAWLMWDGPFRPVAVTGPAAAVLSRMNGHRDVEGISQVLGVPLAPVREVVRSLYSLGACTDTTAQGPH